MGKHGAWRVSAILTCLAGCTGHGVGTPTPELTAPDAAGRGAQIFAGNCVACHQQDARGMPGVYPSLVGSPVLLGDSRELALWVIRGQRPVSLPAGRYPTVMPQFGWMKPPDAAALFTYLRSHFGNEAAAVDAATVAQALGR